MSRDMMADLEAEDEEFEEYDDFDFDEEAVKRRQERDAKTDDFRVYVANAMAMLNRQIETLTSAQAELARLQAQTIKILGQLAAAQSNGQRLQSDGVQAIQRLGSALMSQHEETKAILSAPRELIRDKDGKPTGVKIKHG
jgi:uncharacterized small protein (DUF1192 family)